MARIAFNIGGYEDEDGNLNTGVAYANLAAYLHELTRDLGIIFDDITEIDPLVGLNEVLAGARLEFTGSYEDLVALIDRYEEDPELRPGHIAQIKDIHN